MAQVGTTNMEAYLRKMSIDGYILKLDLPELKEMLTLKKVKSSSVEATRKFRKEGVGREPFHKGFSPDGFQPHATAADAKYRRRFSMGGNPSFAVYILRKL